MSEYTEEAIPPCGTWHKWFSKYPV